MLELQAFHHLSWQASPFVLSIFLASTNSLMWKDINILCHSIIKGELCDERWKLNIIFRFSHKLFSVQIMWWNFKWVFCFICDAMQIFPTIYIRFPFLHSLSLFPVVRNVIVTSEGRHLMQVRRDVRIFRRLCCRRCNNSDSLDFAVMLFQWHSDWPPVANRCSLQMVGRCHVLLIVKDSIFPWQKKKL